MVESLPFFEPPAEEGGLGSRDAPPWGLVGNAPAFREAIEHLPEIARSDHPVLLTGETGTGKEMVARAIHSLSPRSGFPFVPVNCGALPEALLEDELFGHETGAFTDARSRRLGLITQGERGTVFLDEIDALSATAQTVLLRVLQDSSVRHLGSDVERRVDVRFISATNTSIPALIVKGAFRADLYFRLRIHVVHLPPLREREEDIQPLAQHFMKKHRIPGEPAPRLASEAEAALVAHTWPGNVRELENSIVGAIALVRDGLINAKDLRLRSASRVSLPPLREGLSFHQAKRRAVEDFERAYLIRLLEEHHGQITAAARQAGLRRQALQRLLKRHGLDRSGFDESR